MHALLAHFGRMGFDGAPRPIGIDGDCELLTWIEGDAPGPDSPPPTGDEAVVALGRLLRRMHDAQAGFRPPPDAAWQRLPAAVGGSEVICHNDVLGTNVIVRGGLPIALVDWELAAPGPRLLDLATAASWWVPLRRPEGAIRWGLPLDRGEQRLRLLVDGYGLDAAGRRELPAMVVAVARSWYESYRIWGAAERRPRWAEWWDEGRGDILLAEARWLEELRPEVERWLR